MKKYVIFIAVILILLASACKKNNEKTESEGTAHSSPSVSSTTSQVTSPTTIISTLTTAPISLPPEDYENPIVKTAESLIGIEFAENGASIAEGFDNSGFIYYVMRENGYISCPRRLSEQLNWGENVGYDEIKAGDLVYFSDEVGENASFGGIYAGGGIMIYSPFPGESVKKADITGEYFKSRFVTAISL